MLKNKGKIEKIKEITKNVEKDRKIFKVFSKKD